MENSLIGYISRHQPDAVARIKGSDKFPSIRGAARFYSTWDGVIVYTEASGLPYDRTNPFGIFACHIHSGESCTGNQNDPFADADGHFNPGSTEHPYHAGDLPPLFANWGYAWGAVLTARFKLSEVIEKTIIIHEKPDDFTTQPSGNSGAKIACGIITRY